MPKVILLGIKWQYQDQNSGLMDSIIITTTVSYTTQKVQFGCFLAREAGESCEKDSEKQSPMVSGESTGTGGRPSWVQIFVLPPINFVQTLGKLLNFVKPQFPHLQSRENNISFVGSRRQPKIRHGKAVVVQCMSTSQPLPTGILPILS